MTSENRPVIGPYRHRPPASLHHKGNLHARAFRDDFRVMRLRDGVRSTTRPRDGHARALTTGSAWLSGRSAVARNANGAHTLAAAMALRHIRPGVDEHLDSS